MLTVLRERLTAPRAPITMDSAEQPHAPHLRPVTLACHDCDALFTVGPLGKGDRAICPRCGCLLLMLRPRTLQRSTAWALGAASLFLVANAFPFLTLEASGQHSEIVLARSVGALHEHGSPALAVAVAVFILAAPAFIIAGNLYVLIPLLLGARMLPGVRWVARGIGAVSRWNMTEVFLLGVLVSLLKLAEMASVTLGVAFWAFSAMIVCLTASLASIDRRRLWDGIESASAAAAA